MKNQHRERLAHQQRNYHRSHPWRLSRGGLYVPHCYSETPPDALSWWDDVGFILNGRRYIVWWQHPRHLYENKIGDLAWKEVGQGPDEDWLIEGATKQYRKLGASRKKVVSYLCGSPSEPQKNHYKRLHDVEDRLRAEGVDYDVPVSWRRERLTWAMGMSLIAPLEVRNATELAEVANLARRLVLRQTTLDKEFPGYRYGRAQWLEESARREAASNELRDKELS